MHHNFVNLQYLSNVIIITNASLHVNINTQKGFVNKKQFLARALCDVVKIRIKYYAIKQIRLKFKTFNRFSGEIYFPLFNLLVNSSLYFHCR